MEGHITAFNQPPGPPSSPTISPPWTFYICISEKTPFSPISHCHTRGTSPLSYKGPPWTMCDILDPSGSYFYSSMGQTSPLTGRGGLRFPWWALRGQRVRQRARCPAGARDRGGRPSGVQRPRRRLTRALPFFEI